MGTKTSSVETTKTVNPNAGEETGTAKLFTETAAPDSTATVAAEPEQFTCHEKGCEFTGPVEAFKAPDLRNMVAAIRAATKQTGRITLTREQMVNVATCIPCADRIQKERGVAYYPLQWGLNRVASFGKKSDTVADTMGSSVASESANGDSTANPEDSEAATMVACWVCGEEKPRSKSFILGWWGAQLTAAARLRKENPGERRPLVHVSSAMLLETSKERSLVTCKDCVSHVRPTLAQAASNLPEIRDLSEKDQEREIRRRLNPYSLMEAIGHARRTEDNNRVNQARQAEIEAKQAEAEQARQASIADLFSFKAQEREQRNGGRKDHRGGGKQKRNGRWNDE